VCLQIRNRGVGAKESRSGLDAVGLALLAGGVVWTYVAAREAGGRPTPVAALLIAAAVTFVAALLIAARAGPLVPGTVAALVLAAEVSFWPDLGAHGPLAGPLGYTNASAALCLQGTVGAAMVAVEVRTWQARVVATLLALALAAATVLTGSQAATLLLLLPVSALVVRPGQVRRVVVALLGLFLLVFATTVLIGAIRPSATSGVVGRVVEEALSARRAALWDDALDLMARNPIVGVGPGRFREESLVARSDPDAAWAHNGFLQQGAEGGVPALVFTLSFFVWGFARLASASERRVVALGAASLAAVGIQASIDYLFHFPALPVVVAALVGTAVGAQPSSRSVSMEGPDERHLAGA
jgi:O-antigen ligase